MALAAELEAVARLNEGATLGGAELEALVMRAVDDYRGVLTRQTIEARGIPARAARRSHRVHAVGGARVRVHGPMLRRMDSPWSTGPKRWWPQRECPGLDRLAIPRGRRREGRVVLSVVG